MRHRRVRVSPMDEVDELIGANLELAKAELAMTSTILTINRRQYGDKVDHLDEVKNRSEEYHRSSFVDVRYERQLDNDVLYAELVSNDFNLAIRQDELKVIKLNRKIRSLEHSLDDSTIT